MRLLDVKRAATYLSISETNLREYVKTGFLIPLKLPHPSGIGFLERTLFDIRRLDAFIDEVGSNEHKALRRAL